MAYPLSHKAVFVLDWSADMEQPCGHQFEMDSLNKGRAGGLIPLAAVARSMWTCAVMAAVEYCRIVWDVHPAGRLIRLVLNGAQASVVGSWAQADQHLPTLMTHLAAAMATGGGAAGGGAQHAPHAGLAAALGALGEASEAQRADRAADAAAKVMNRGRVVLLTRVADEAHVRWLRDWLQEALPRHNRAADNSDARLTIHSCDLVVVAVHPDGAEPTVAARPTEPLSAILSGSVVTAAAGTQLAPMMMNLVLSHYELASTTVTGIPMKEEQNSGSSANYDVELLHPAKAYEAILQGSAAEHAHLRSRRDGCEYETITLRWCTPRTSSAELHQCTSASRVTPVDVNSRPSSCLTNFLLNGRAVMLEMPRKQGGKFVSHMLAAHGGEIFMHALGSGRSVLEDPPSISEGAGGRVTDYRIPEFGRLIAQNRLAPAAGGADAVPLQTALERLARHTATWPLTLSETALAALPGLDELTSALAADALTPDEALQCKKAVYNLVAMETRHDPLPAAAAGARGRGAKRDEQYRALWAELESLVRAQCRSDGHQAVLECVVECRCQGGAAAEERLGLDQAMEELDRCGAPAADSPPPAPKRWRPGRAPVRQNLLALWTQRVDSDNALKRLEFSGRLNGDGAAVKLYAHLDRDKVEEPAKKK